MKRRKFLKLIGLSSLACIAPSLMSSSDIKKIRTSVKQKIIVASSHNCKVSQKGVGSYIVEFEKPLDIIDNYNYEVWVKN